MALQGFQVQSPSTVILDDRRDPDVSWANHEARYPGQTNRGGVDVVAPVGTPIYAWADGTVIHQPNNGSAGNVVRLALAHDPGWFLDAKHLSRYAVPHGTWVQRGTLIGYSGTSGGVAPHVHYNLVDPRGIRRNPWHYIDNGTASAGQPAPAQEDDMYSDADRKRDDDMAWNVKEIKKTLDDANGFISDGKGNVTKVGESIRGRFDRILYSLEGGVDPVTKKNDGKGIRALVAAVKSKLGA